MFQQHDVKHVLLCQPRPRFKNAFIWREVKEEYRRPMVEEEQTYFLSHVMRKPAFCICENKDAEQLRGNREADQRLCFRYTDSTIPLLPKPEISSL